MSTDHNNPSRRPSTSKSLTPSWPLSYFPNRGRRKSRQEEEEATKVDPSNLLAPLSASSTSMSGDSRSMHSSRSRGRRSSFKTMVNRLRSSSNVSLPCELPIRVADFRQIVEGWPLAFDRYNQLVTTRTSPQGSYPSEEFTKITKILKNKCGGNFFHGLPEAVFDMSLLWCPAHHVERSDSGEPSWSWTGWKGGINYPFDIFNCPDYNSLPKSEGEWFKSEILNFEIGPPSASYVIRREKNDPELRTEFIPWFHVPWGKEPSTESNTLRFSAQTISADGFGTEHLRYNEQDIPCSQLMNEKKQQCGVVMDFDERVSHPIRGGPYEFVLLSRNLRRDPAINTRRPVVPTIHPSGTPIWDGARFIWDEEIDDFDDEVFKTGPWKMLNVMLIRWRGDYAERMAIARIHEDAFNACKPVMKKIVLR